MSVTAMLSTLALAASAASTAAAASLPNPYPYQPFCLISSTPASTPCLRSSYYGAYGGGEEQDHIYIPDQSCLDHPDVLYNLDEGSLVPLPRDTNNQSGRLIWVGPAGVAGDLDLDHGLLNAWEDITLQAELVNLRKGLKVDDDDNPTVQTLQTVFQTACSGDYCSEHYLPTKELPQLVHMSTDSLLIHVPNSLLPIVDTLLPAHLVPVALPTKALPTPIPNPLTQDLDESGSFSNDWGVPAKYGKHLANITSHLEFDARLDEILGTISMDGIRRNVRWMTGEAPSGIESRHSFTKGALQTAHWIKSQVEESGATCELFHFLEGFAPNVLCEYPSIQNSSEHVILSAHFDSRGSWGSTRAPGGDDDGSGTGHLLGVVEAIKENQISFEKSVIVAFFAGEEQGLLGSRAFAEHLHDGNVTVLLQIQADMLGFHAPGEPMQLGLPATIHLPEASYLLGNLSHLYSPELLVGSTAACCSDHQSFLSLGFPATQVFERNGPIVDPKYHNSGDLTHREGYDFDQIVSIAKVTMAGIMTVAGWHAPALREEV